MQNQVNYFNHVRIFNFSNNSSTQKPSGADSWPGQEELEGNMVKLSREDQELIPLVRFLATAIRPAKIFRLRHKALNGNNSDDYIDLMIIVASTEGRSFDELETLLEIPCREKRITCSLHNAGNVVECLNRRHLFYTLHCRPENLLYDDRKLNLPIISSAELAEKKQTIREQIDRYMQKPIDFSKAAAYFLDTEPSGITIFLLQQAVELTYRGILRYLGGRDKKTHEIRALKKWVRRCAPQLCEIFPDDCEEESHLLDILEQAYLKARYEENYPVSDEECAKLFDRVLLLQQTAIKLAKEVTKE